jgi:hypothetical protein
MSAPPVIYGAVRNQTAILSLEFVVIIMIPTLKVLRRVGDTIEKKDPVTGPRMQVKVLALIAAKYLSH